MFVSLPGASAKISIHQLLPTSEYLYKNSCGGFRNVTRIVSSIFRLVSLMHRAENQTECLGNRYTGMISIVKRLAEEIL